MLDVNLAENFSGPDSIARMAVWGRREALPRRQEVPENGGLVGSGLDREPLGKAFGISAHRYCFAIHGQRDPAGLARNLDSMPGRQRLGWF